MPNWCQNVATITHEDKELIDNIENELKEDKDNSGLFQMLRPRPSSEEENWYSWNIDNWGTKWEASVYDFERIDDYTIKVNFDTAWGPCIALYEYMETEGYTVEGFYNEEGMAFAGCFRDGFNDYYDYSDLDSAAVQYEIPSDIDEMFSISERKQEWEAENEEDSDDEEEDEEPEYEMTDWFDSKNKPVREGVYEVKTKSWPFPHKAEWRKNKWYTFDMDGQEYTIHSDVVSEWRGITQAQHDLCMMLEDLKADFDKQLESETK